MALVNVPDSGQMKGGINPIIRPAFRITPCRHYYRHENINFKCWHLVPVRIRLISSFGFT